MSRHLKSKKNLVKLSQNRVVIPKKNPIKRNVKVPDFIQKIKNYNISLIKD